MLNCRLNLIGFSLAHLQKILGQWLQFFVGRVNDGVQRELLHQLFGNSGIRRLVVPMVERWRSFACALGIQRCQSSLGIQGGALGGFRTIC